MIVLKRWYEKEMAKYQLDDSVFQDTELSCTDVEHIVADFNTKWGFPTEKGVVYGIWKPKKHHSASLLAWLVKREDIHGVQLSHATTPRVHKALMRLLQHVEKALKEKDKLRQREEGIRAFLGIDSV